MAVVVVIIILVVVTSLRGNNIGQHILMCLSQNKPGGHVICLPEHWTVLVNPAAQLTAIFKNSFDDSDAYIHLQ